MTGTADFEAVSDPHSAFGSAHDHQVPSEDGALHQPSEGDGTLPSGVDVTFHDPLDAEVMGIRMDIPLEPHIPARHGMNGLLGFGYQSVAE